MSRIVNSLRTSGFDTTLAPYLSAIERVSNFRYKFNLNSDCPLCPSVVDTAAWKTNGKKRNELRRAERNKILYV